MKRLNFKKIQKVMNEYEKQVFMRDYNKLNKYLGNLKFFIKFPQDIKLKLLQSATLREYNKDEVIYRQGDSSSSYHVIVKGTVCVNVIKEELGYIPFNYKICYDGDYFGELAHFDVSPTLTLATVNELNK